MSILITRALLWRSRKKVQFALWLATQAQLELDRLLDRINGRSYAAGCLLVILLQLM